MNDASLVISTGFPKHTDIIQCVSANRHRSVTLLSEVFVACPCQEISESGAVPVALILKYLINRMD